MAGGLPVGGCGQRARSGARFQQTHRVAHRRVDRGDTARGEHQKELAGHVHTPEPRFQLAQVALDTRLYIDVRNGRRGALELTNFGYHVRRDRHAHSWRGAMYCCARGLFVRGVGEAVQKRNRHRLDADRRQLARQPLDIAFVERAQDAAVGQGALGHVETQVARHQWARVFQHQVVEVVAVLAPDLHRVAEARRSQQSGARAFALDHGVGDERGAVDDLGDLGGRDAGALQRLGQHGLDRLRGVVGRGEHLAHGKSAGTLLDHNQVGEGTANIHAHAVAS